jgi:transcriptional regulator with XRE-family HTH domain
MSNKFGHAETEQIIREIVGRNIRHARLSMPSRTSQRQFAALLDTAPTVVGRWERGERIPNLESLAALVDLTGWDPGEFYGAPPSPGKSLAELEQEIREARG